MNPNLESQFDLTKRIKDVRTSYVVKITLSNNLAVEFGKYADNFFCAAHRIACFLLCEEKVDISQLDTYIFPLAFLYRHSVELFLKGIAFQSIVDKEERITFLKITSHNLKSMLQELLKTGICDFKPEKAEIAWLNAYFESISLIDKASDSFRYPFHLKRDVRNFYYMEDVFPTQTHIDLVKFVNKFETAIETLKHWYHKTIESAKWETEHKTDFVETGGSYYEQSVVGYGYQRNKYYPYFNGYKDTAQMLFQEMKREYDKGNTVDSHAYFFPMCYLYRNSLELALKSVWMEEITEIDFQTRSKFLIKNKHNIFKLWEKIFEEIATYEDRDHMDLEKLGSCLKELNKFDCDGTIFKYPCDKDLRMHFKNGDVFDFVNVAVLMDTLIKAVDGIGDDIALRNEWNSDCYACGFYEM